MLRFNGGKHDVTDIKRPLAQKKAIGLLGLLLILVYAYTYAAALPSPTTGSAGRMSIPNNAVATRVLKVVDGDTIDVLLQGKETRIRYIGVNTPETKKPGSPVEYYGREAEQANRMLVEGKTVYLTFDVERKDKYGRTLAYVWLKPATFVNGWLVEQGFAQVSTFPPNVRYVELFRKLQQGARDSNKGLWGRQSSTNLKEVTLTPADVVIQTVDLDGEYVVLVNTSKQTVKLDGWRLVSEVGDQQFRFPNGTMLKPGASLRIGSGPKQQPAGTIVWTRSYIWSNDGDPAALYDAKGVLVARHE